MLSLSPPAWLPLAALILIIAVSALRVFGVERTQGAKRSASAVTP